MLQISQSASAQRMREMRHGLDGPRLEQRQQYDNNDPRYRRHPSGGRPAEFDAKYGAQAASGAAWRITKDCASACTMGFGKFDKSKICIARGVKLGFHEGRNPSSTQMMVRSYPSDVMGLVNSRGGIRPEWLWIPAREFHRIGYKAC
jgi:hypothetical protein